MYFRLRSKYYRTTFNRLLTSSFLCIAAPEGRIFPLFKMPCVHTAIVIIQHTIYLSQFNSLNVRRKTGAKLQN